MKFEDALKMIHEAEKNQPKTFQVGFTYRAFDPDIQQYYEYYDSFPNKGEPGITSLSEAEHIATRFSLANPKAMNVQVFYFNTNTPASTIRLNPSY